MIKQFTDCMRWRHGWRWDHYVCLMVVAAIIVTAAVVSLANLNPR